MLTYALKSALTLALLYSGFLALLSRETFHRLNRLLLLFCMVASLVVPILPPVASPPALFQGERGAITLFNEWLQSFDNPVTAHREEFETASIEPSNAQTVELENVSPSAPKDYMHTSPLGERLRAGELYSSARPLAACKARMGVRLLVYYVGVFVMLIILLFRVLLLLSLMRDGLRHTDAQGNTVILKRGNVPPFSIFRTIVMSVSDYEQHRQPILTHEQEHIRLHHTLDLLLLEAVRVVQWFNPFVWLLGRDLEAVHEYEADEAVICRGIDATQYQQLLVMKALGSRLQPFAHNLNRGSLKKRINMMQRKPSPRWHKLRALFAIPAVALAVYAFATPSSDYNLDAEVLPTNNLPDSLRIDLRHAVLPTSSTSITNSFGESGGRLHKGIDLRLSTGDTVRAAFDGTVTTVGNLPQSYGLYVILRHANGLETVYAHLSRQLVADNKVVRAGQPIGLGGNTGRSTGAHLHFETRLGGKVFDPTLLFDFRHHRPTAATVGIDADVTGLEQDMLLEIDGQQITNKAELKQALPNDSDVATITVLGPKTATALYGDRGKDGAVVITTKQADEEPVFDICEEKAKYEGGDMALMQLIAQNVKYPKMAIEEGVQGRVIVQFVVEKNGTISQLQVVRNSYDETAPAPNPVTAITYGKDNQEELKAGRQKIAAEQLNQEALRVVRLTNGHWTPGRQQGQPVRSRFTLPVNFRLN